MQLIHLLEKISQHSALQNKTLRPVAHHTPEHLTNFGLQHCCVPVTKHLGVWEWGPSLVPLCASLWAAAAAAAFTLSAGRELHVSKHPLLMHRHALNPSLWRTGLSPNTPARNTQRWNSAKTAYLDAQNCAGTVLFILSEREIFGRARQG